MEKQAIGTATRLCLACNSERPISEFYIRRGRASGNCKLCVCASQRKYYAENKEWLLRNQKEYRDNNLELIRKKDRDRHFANRAHRLLKKREHYKNNRSSILRRRHLHWLENRDRLIPYHKHHYRANTDRILTRNRAYRKANAESSRAVSRRWKRNNPERVRSINHARRARSRNSSGRWTQSDIKRQLAHQNGRCVGILPNGNTCRKVLRGEFHIDHYEPLSPRSKLMKVGSNAPDNLQLLCPECNFRKSNHDPYEWAKRHGRLF